MKQVAIIAYWYPPLQAPGALRAASLARHLPSAGWQPLVVTVRPVSSLYLAPGAAGRADRSPAPDPSLRTRDRSLHALAARLARADAPEAMERLKSENAQAGSSALLRGLHGLYRQGVAFPDEVWPWLVDLPRIRRHLRDASIAAIISTSPPATVHLMARRLARALAVPWIADLRDPWSQRTAWRRLPPLQALEARLERRTLAEASALVTVSAPLADALAGLHGRPVIVIPNGFEADDGCDPPDAPLPIDPARFTLVHTGTLTHGTRDPARLLAAVDRVCALGALDPGQIEIWLVGRHLDVARRSLADWPRLVPAVRLVPLVDRATALDAQRRATVLVVLGTPDPRHAGDVTTKVFEYLHARRPILAIGAPEGALADLLASTGGGTVASTTDEVVAALLHWAHELRRTGSVAWQGRPSEVARYDRRAGAAAFAGLLDRLTGSVTGGGGR